jgi:hypothetical protein
MVRELAAVENFVGSNAEISVYDGDRDAAVRFIEEIVLIDTFDVR